MTGDGIDFIPNAASSLAVSNSVVADNVGQGIFLQPNASVTAGFNRVELNNNANGIYVFGGTSPGRIQSISACQIALPSEILTA